VSVRRIALDWPSKAQRARQGADGTWHVDAEADVRELHPFVLESNTGHGRRFSAVITGDRFAALDTLRRGLAAQVRLIYADVPRLEGFDETRAFQGEAGRVWNTWLTAMRQHFVMSAPLLADDGVLVVHCGDLEESFVKGMLFEQFGPENYLGTIVWRSHYSPRGGKDSTEVAVVHEYLVCFARDRSLISRVALPVLPEGYSNPDADPRGPWEARQKDAGRDTSRVQYNVPPYRWEIVSGSLPPGLWRLSPMSGVIWGTPSTPGTYEFRVRVADMAEDSVEASFTLDVRAQPEAPSAGPVWWIANPPPDDGSGLRIVSNDLPAASADHTYSVALEAAGGKPFRGTPRPSRGWGFGQATLEAAIAEDRCYFGRKGTSIPEPKRYLSALAGGQKLVNVGSWWGGDEVGWSQDATKSLKDLLEAGVIERTSTTAKPAQLLDRLLRIFGSSDGVALELFARTGDLLAAGISEGYRVVALAGASDLDQAFTAECMVPRAQHVLDSDTVDSHGEVSLRVYSVGRPIAWYAPGLDEHPQLEEHGRTESEMNLAVLTSQGFFEDLASDDATGSDFFGRTSAVVLGYDDYADALMAAAVMARHPGHSLAIYYYRGAPDGDTISLSSSASLRRVPMDLLR
jgi:hypothetical protein